MTLFKTFRNWEVKYTLTFMGFVVGVFGAAFALYIYFQKAAPQLRIEVLDGFNVVEVKDDNYSIEGNTWAKLVGKLEILYDGVNLRSNRQTLTIVVLKISNDGAATIPLTAYDTSALAGVGFETINVVHASREGITYGPEASSKETMILKGMLEIAPTEYLFTHLKLNISPSEVTFEPVILEPGDSFKLKLLILHPDNSNVTFIPTGKIAGIKHIQFLPLNAQNAPPSLWNRVLGGDYKTQCMRTVVYGMLCIVVIIAARCLTGMISRWQERELKARSIGERP